MNTKFDVKKLAVLSVLSALAFAVTLITNLIPPVMFLSFDAKDAVILIASLIYGPISGFMMTVAVSFIEMITISTTGFIGFIMNVLSTVAFACVGSFIYQKMRNIKGMITGLVTGILVSTGVMILWNYLITPLYMKVPREAVVELLLPLFLPFNLIKSGINAALVLLLYKRVVTILRKTHLLQSDKTVQSKTSTTVIVTVTALFALLTFVLLFLVLRGYY